MSASVRPLPKQIQGGEWSQLTTDLIVSIVDAIHDRCWPIYLCGEAGRGKTFAMATVYRHWPVNPAVWIDVQPWLRRLMSARVQGTVSYQTACGQRAEVTESQMLDQVQSARLLCVDDCGVRTDSEAQQSSLLELLNMRGNRPTIITGNHDPENLHKIFDSRIASRLLAGRALCLQGPDKRLGKSPILEIDV